MQTQSLTGGFADAPVESARAFRAILEAMARPGLRLLHLVTDVEVITNGTTLTAIRAWS